MTQNCLKNLDFQDQTYFFFLYPLLFGNMASQGLQGIFHACYFIKLTFG